MVLTKGIFFSTSFISAVGLFLINVIAMITDAIKNTGPKYFFILRTY